MKLEDKEVVVSVKNVEKIFKIPHERHSSLKSTVIHWGTKGYRRFEALRDVNFEVHKGEFFGIIGQNGSGKSTLLKILAQIYTPTKGDVKINGRLSPFIELGVGFNPELTAAENVYLNGAILGMSHAEMDEQFDQIIAFAELEDFVDQKLKNFSSGMLVRLAFSVAIRAHADILLIDEVLAVGDANFQQKCFDVFRRLKAEGKTIIFVSHDLASIREFSDRVMLLNKGTEYGIFSATKAIAKYAQINQERVNDALIRQGKPARNAVKQEDLPHMRDLKLFDENGKEKRSFERGKHLRIQVEISNPKKQPLAVGVAIYRVADGFYCFGTNTGLEKMKLKEESTLKVDVDYKAFPLQQGIYDVTVGVFDPTLREVYEMTEHVLDFQVSQPDDTQGITYIDHKWSQEN